MSLFKGIKQLTIKVFEFTLLVSKSSFSIKHRLASSSFFDDELEDESSDFWALPFFSYFLLAPFSFLIVFGHLTLICPRLPQLKQVYFAKLKSVIFLELYLFEEYVLSLLLFFKNLPNFLVSRVGSFSVTIIT